MEVGAQGGSGSGAERSLAATGDDYQGAGAKKSHHGYTFQFHLLMLFAVRALNLGYDFKLGTEVADADKLDDIVFSYLKGKHEGSRRFFRFVQCKHTQREQKETLRAAQLFEEPNKEFSLRMYFNAFRKLLHGEKLLGKCDEIQDVIICTNMNFKNCDRHGDFVIDEHTFTTNGPGIGEKDDILRNEMRKFSSSFQGKEALLLHLKNGAIRIPSKFAVCVLNDMEYSSNDGTECCEPQLSQLYENVLRDEVVDLKTLKFRASFSHTDALSSVAKHFHEELFAQYLKCGNIVGEKSKKTFCDFVEKKDLHHSMKLFSMGGFYLDSPKQLAKRLSRILDKNRNSGVVQVVSEKSVLWQHFKSLMKFVLIEEAGRITFSPEFIQLESLPGNLDEFRDYLKKGISYFQLELKDLENYSFEIDLSSWMIVVDDSLNVDVSKFLEVLTFSLSQPSIEEMEVLVLEEIKSYFGERDVRNAYLRFFKMMYSWADSKNGKYLTGKDVEKFFCCIQKEFLGRIRFNLLEPVQNFIGRESELKELHEWLHRDKQEDLIHCRKAVISQSTAISGLGGIGKSELARKYAQIHFGSLYDNIVWIDSEGNERLEKCFYMLAFDILGIKKENHNGDNKAFESIIWETYKFFEGKKTLFIFDNADFTSNLAPYLPKMVENKHMFILITSRYQNWGDMDVLQLENLSLDEACDFIKISVGHLSQFSSNDAIALANTLNCFPLAIKQAVSYIKEMSQKMENLGREFSIKQYVILFEKKTKELLDYNFPSDFHNSYSRTTFKTMKIAIDYVKKYEHGEVAIYLLNMMSYLSPDDIDLRVLCCYLVNYDDVELAAGLELLKIFSIASVKESKASIHRLVQLVNRVCLKESGEERDVLMKSLNLALLLGTEHAISVWDFSSHYADVVEKFHRVPLMIIEQLSDRLMTKAALEFGEKAISTLKAHLGPELHEIIFIRRGMGRALYFHGKSEQSLDFFQEAAEGLKRIYGENPDFLWCKNYLGVALVQLGRYRESIALFEEVLTKGRDMVEEDSKLLFTAKNQLSRVFGLMGNTEESQKYLKDSVSHSQKIVEEYKEVSSRYAGYQAMNLSDLKGKVQKQKELFDFVTTKSMLNYALDIDNVIQAYVNISLQYSSEGNFIESLKKAEEAYELVTLKFGEKHLKSVNIKGMIALNMFHLGKTDLALNMLRELETIHFEFAGMSLGSIHTKLKIAEILHKQSKLQEALNEYEEIEMNIKASSRTEDPTMVHCKHRLALLYCCIGKPNDAVKKLGESFEILQTNAELADFIHNLISEMEDIGELLLPEQNKKGTLQVFKYVYHLKKQYKGEHDIDTLETKFIFSEIYCHLKGKIYLEKGIDYLVELNGVLLSKLAEKDPRVEMLMMKIYKILIQLQQFEKAKSMMIETCKEVGILGNDSQFIVSLKSMIVKLESL